MTFALTGAKPDERDTALGMVAFAGLDTTGVTLIADRGYRRASFETELNQAGITLIRPNLKSEPARPGRFAELGNESGPVRSDQLSIIETLDRDNVDDLAALTRSVEPLYDTFLNALQDGAWEADEELELHYRNDLEAQRR